MKIQRHALSLMFGFDGSLERKVRDGGKFGLRPSLIPA